ncbi:MAG: response regulator [Aliivibrio sp.]|uniref:response regulator n=1 Tax=Aliivibrio sp. TaxID=1872443 RepID=UPI001A48C107|nr:response regulator [Aliivibrio sp.]
MKTLVVDDQETMRKVILHILQQLGYSNITTAEDGKDAFRKLAAGNFDFVVSDWNIPNMSGIQLLKA